jgi:hypothetical protein
MINELEGEASPELEERMTLRMKSVMKIRRNPKQEEKVQMIKTLLQNHVFYALSIITIMIDMVKLTCPK